MQRAEQNQERQTSAQQEHKQTKEQLFWEIFRFLLVGGGATLCDYFVFWLLDGVLFPMCSLTGFWETAALWISTACGFVVGMLVNWVLSVKFVFRAVRNQEEVKSKKSFLIFVVISLVGLFLTLLGVWGLTVLLPEFALFGKTHLLGTAWNKWLAKVIMTCLVLIWNYLGRKLLIFK